MSILVPIDAKELIRKEFTPQSMSNIVLIVEQGYRLAKEATKHLSFLDWDLGQRHEGYLRPLAINYLMKREVENGTLPFTISFEFNRNKSHKYVLYGTGKTKMTISQVNSSKVTARPAFFRSKLQLANQICFDYFGDLPSNSEEYYLLLTYSRGGEKPRFVNLGIPNGNHWIEKINLMDEPRQILQPKDKLDDEEIISQETLIGLRKFAEEVEGSGN